MPDNSPINLPAPPMTPELEKLRKITLGDVSKIADLLSNFENEPKPDSAEAIKKWNNLWSQFG